MKRTTDTLWFGRYPRTKTVAQVELPRGASSSPCPTIHRVTAARLQRVGDVRVCHLFDGPSAISARDFLVSVRRMSL